ncbi:PP2C family protein-serine/threonine phosphatase [Paludibacterium purpuratum]|uniref:Stage II sporulation protein E n=1 Tax=Paludibacterium purpuratum TaxID=1144873 RepID=A0A4R7AX62_9NEIS|nr:SpoIIE family protein phosphatase [Paludibacterium purpuratum]TDR71057.1 stage II sporulation protein E [Paludibacterium purpuratum]
MQLYALVSEATRRRMGVDPWLSCFEWHFIEHPGAVPTTGMAALFVLEGDLLPSGQALRDIACPCWCFAVSARVWDLPPHFDLFESPLDIARLGDRLLAWMWVEGELSPACVAGLTLSLLNGCMSLTTREPDSDQVQMAVSPTDAVGGDMALYWQRPGRDLAVLADAIGHGDTAALDVAQFMLDVLRLLRDASLSSTSLAQLCHSQTARLAWGRFVAVAVVELNREAATLTLANAGMPAILVLQSGRPMATYASMQPPLGLAACPEPPLYTVPLLPATQWVLTSDGVDAAALCDSLTDFDLTQQSDNQSVSLLFQGIPLKKSTGILDDASQIVLFILHDQ